MRTLLLLIAFSACMPTRQTEWTVTKIERDGPNEAWIVTAKSDRGSQKFITDCRPDSIGSRFLAAPKR